MSKPIPGESEVSAQESLRRTVVEGDAPAENPPSKASPADNPPSKASPAVRQSRDWMARGADNSVVPRCRPVQRPPMAVLQILDDSTKTAETVRIRKTPFVIGRAEGDFTVPHDAMISHRHAEITRTQVDDKWTWELRDLESRNGTFMQVKECLLEPGAEILLARLRFRFMPATKTENLPPTADIRQTQVWGSRSITNRVSQGYLVEWTPEGDGRRIPLSGEEEWLGRDPQKTTIFLDDLAVNPSHARITRDSEGRWQITDDHSVNGTWLRVDATPLASGAVFLLGEQVFTIVFP